MSEKLVVIEVSDEPVIAGRPYTDAKTGAARTIPAKQKCYLHQGERYPLAFELPVDDVAGPRRPGRYLLGGACFELKGNTAGYVRMSFSDRGLRLIAVEEAVAYLSGKPAVRAAA
jgi:hypothetical protein